MKPLSATKKELIKIMLPALKYPSNEAIKPQIRRSLNDLGISDKEIEFYELTGECPSLFEGDISDEMEDLSREMGQLEREMEGFDHIFGETPKALVKRKKSILKFFTILMLLSFLALVAGVFGIISLSDDGETPAKDIPAITESTPMQDGDKL